MNDKVSIEDASVEEILWDLCNHENPDTDYRINVTQDGGICVANYDFFAPVAANTLKEALILKVKTNSYGMYRDYLDGNFYYYERLTIDWISLFKKWFEE